MKLSILIGTRPEIIKMAPVIRECQRLGVDLKIIHSNQHYSPELDSIFFSDLKLPRPDFNLGVGSASHAVQTAKIMTGLEKVLLESRPDCLLVHGDTNTTLSGALVASKMGIQVGHVEAGLRSYDRDMPEELNRIVVDHLSDFLFAVGARQAAIIRKEGIPDSRVATVGNTIVDAVQQNITLATESGTTFDKLNLRKKDYAVLTAHRPSNVDSPTALKEVVSLLTLVKTPVVWPIHPRTKALLSSGGIALPSNVIALEPIGYLDFLQLLANSSLIITDSGGLQEEACILGIKCLTIRENTERPETVEVGANFLVGRNAELFEKALRTDAGAWSNPFGDGTASVKILSFLSDRMAKPISRS